MAENCPQCHYTPAPKKEEKEECPQCFYGPATTKKEETECPQCFYDPSQVNKPEPAPAAEKKEEAETCSQCFYTPPAKPKEEEECAQCFYTAPKKEKEPECPQCFYGASGTKSTEPEPAPVEKDEAKVIVYTMPECGFCQMVKGFLKGHHIDFKEVDITTSREAQRFMESRGYISAPVTVIGDKEIMGAEISEIKKALGMA